MEEVVEVEWKRQKRQNERGIIRGRMKEELEVEWRQKGRGSRGSRGSRCKMEIVEVLQVE